MSVQHEMKINLLLFTTFFMQIALGQTTLKRDEIVTVVQKDTLVGEYYKHLPIKGKFEQLMLYQHPNGTFDYVTIVAGEFQDGKRIGSWTYIRFNQLYFWIDVEKEVQFYADSTIITSDFGRIKYNSDSTIVNASISGMYSKVDISCKKNLCFFESQEKANNRFCFPQDYLDDVINQLREGYPEIEIYFARGLKERPQ
jgi:hypothetical protein